MAAAAHCLALPTKLANLSLNSPSTSSSTHSFTSLCFSANLSTTFFSRGNIALSPAQWRPRNGLVVCEVATKRKADSADKRARQAEKRRLYNKSRKSEIKTRMKKVLEALDALQKKPDAAAEEVLSVEKLIGEAYSTIDKAVKVGTLHRNTGARRKSRLARRKKAVEIHHGWYTPTPVASA